MLLQLIHRTHYHYSEPVFLEPFIVRLRPRSDAAQTVKRYNINISPQPSGLSHCTGLEGNNTETVWFAGTHENLTIETQVIVDTHFDDPYNFLITDKNALRVPLKYEPHLERTLSHYLERYSDSSETAAFAQELMQASNNETIPFLSLLAAQIQQRIEYLLREHGEPWLPEETLQQGQGSCRDFAVLFVDVCRSAGIAARFVSGYCMGDVAADSHMHAWAEVYLPGAGWRGYDPSRGLAVSEDHIAVSSGQRPLDASPTEGSFRGKADSSMEAEISIRQIKAEEIS
jgi:transglutaminase-like putative cysteine protease